jgi:hypothetical protein
MTGLEMGLMGVVVAQAGAIAILLRQRNRRAQMPSTEEASGWAEERPPVRTGSSASAWAADRRKEVLIESLLDEWTEACVAASESGWVLGIPTGEILLDAWARLAGDGPIAAPAEAFGIWLVGQIGKSTRRGIKTRELAARRDVLARDLARVAGRLLKGLDEDLVLESRAPAGVGPRQRNAWLIDREVAEVLGGERVGDFVQPVMVLRPLLKRGEQVLLEGEVA